MRDGKGRSAMKLPKDYSIREISWEEWRKLSKKLSLKIFFSDSLIFPILQSLSDAEKKRIDKLRKRNSFEIFRLALAIFYKKELAGWAVGYQKDSFTFYMMSSAVHPKHRRKGLYTLLLKRTLDRVKQEGFIEITSRHNSTNNEVIIPKLKAGFIIKSMELSEIFGTLIHLSYFPKKIHRDLMKFRSGDAKPKGKIKKLLKL